MTEKKTTAIIERPYQFTPGSQAVTPPYERVRRAPLWVLRLRQSNRVLSGVVALVLTLLIAVIASAIGYTVPMFIAVFMVPLIPGTILSSANVAPAEINAQLDTFTFMSVMPTLFVVVTGAVVLGLIGYAMIKKVLHYVFMLWSVAGVNSEIFAAVTAERELDKEAYEPRTKRKHLADRADDMMNKSGSAKSAKAQSAAESVVEKKKD